MFAVIIEEPKKIKKENKVNHETVEIIFSFFIFFSRSQKISFNFIYTHYLVSFYKKKKKKMLLLVVNNYKVKCMLCALDSLSNSRVSSLEMKKKNY